MFECSKSFAFLLIFLVTREGSAVSLDNKHEDPLTVPLRESATHASKSKGIIPINISVAPVVLIPVNCSLQLSM
jgi:hypothetical protein